MFHTMQEARQFAEKQHVRWIDLKFSDFAGTWRHVTLPADRRSWELVELSGVGFDASSVGLMPLEKADMVVKPVWYTGFIDPFFPEKTMSFICEARDITTDEPSPLDPRACAVRAMEYARKTGLCDEALFAPEYEFYVFDHMTQFSEGLGNGYQLTPLYDLEPSDENRPGPHGGYHAAPPVDRILEYRSAVCRVLVDLGVPVHYHHHEVGGAGQSEIEVRLTPLVRAADHAMLVKYVCRQVARQQGVSVTFMPKPLYKHPGSGMHCHQTLHKNGQNLFYDADGYAGLSATALQYIAGILDNGSALLALTNPSVNSYKRLVPGYEAPTKAFFSPGNRSAAVRIPTYARSATEQRIEFRTPDATCNPYFLVAGQLMAGLEGIRSGKDPKALGLGPVEENIFSWPPERLATLRSLPTQLDQALEALEANHAFLTAGDVFSEHFIRSWVKTKRKDEERLIGNPHPLEVEMYYGF
jgi:glutamine synthetase